MNNKIINIKKIIEKEEKPLLKKYLKFYKKNNIKPGMAAILTNNDPGSKSYMKGIKNFCNKWGVHFESYQKTNETELIKTINDLNNSKKIDGYIIMYPTNFDKKDTHYMNLVKTNKDLEGLTNTHLGYLVQFEKYADTKKLKKLIIPPTAKGVLYIFKKYSKFYETYKEKNGYYPDNLDKNPFEIEGKKITIINDSLAVGRSLGLMLLNENGSVRICHEYTDFDDIIYSIKNSDIIISAVPSENFVIPTNAIPNDSLVIDISFHGNFEYPNIFNKVYKISQKWKLTDKGNRINDMTLYRLLINLFYLINQNLDDKKLKNFSKSIRLVR